MTMAFDHRFGLRGRIYNIIILLYISYTSARSRTHSRTFTRVLVYLYIIFICSYTCTYYDMRLGVCIYIYTMVNGVGTILGAPQQDIAL